MLSLFNQRRRKPFAAKSRGAKGVMRRGMFGRPWRQFPIQRAMFTPSNPYSDEFVHRFMRLGSRARLSINSDGTTPYLEEDPIGGAGQWNIGPLTTDGTGAYTGLGQFGLTFTAKLPRVINSTNFSNMFAQFRIDKIEITVRMLNGPSFGAGSAGSPVTGALPEWFVKFDPNDDLMPPNYESVAQSANCLDWNFSQKTSHTFSFIPKATFITNTPVGAQGVASINLPNAWYETINDDTATLFNGLKIWIRNYQVSLGQTAQFSMEPRYFMSFRRPN